MSVAPSWGEILERLRLLLIQGLRAARRRWRHVRVERRRHRRELLARRLAPDITKYEPGMILPITPESIYRQHRMVVPLASEAFSSYEAELRAKMARRSPPRTGFMTNIPTDIVEHDGPFSVRNPNDFEQRFLDSHKRDVDGWVLGDRPKRIGRKKQ